MWQMMLGQAVGSYSNVLNERAQRNSVEAAGETNTKLAKIKADAIRRNAKARLAAGGTVAQEIQREARVTESDAINAMAAGGTVTDPEMLARLKVRSDANSVAAILQGHREYSGMLSQAGGVEGATALNNITANTEAGLKYHGAKNNFILDMTDIGVKAAKGYKKDPSSWNYKTLKSQGQAQGRGGY